MAKAGLATGIGRVRFDITFGGAFYAIVQADQVGVGLTVADFRQLIDLGNQIKRVVMDSIIIERPFE